MRFDFFVYNQIDLVGILDNYQSIIWNSALNDYAEVKIVAPITANNRKLLVEHNIIVNQNPVIVRTYEQDSTGAAAETWKKRNVACIIVNTNVDTKEGSITAKALTLEYALTYRINSFWAANPMKRTSAARQAFQNSFLRQGDTPSYFNKWFLFNDNWTDKGNTTLEASMKCETPYEAYQRFIPTEQDIDSELLSYGVFYEQRVGDGVNHMLVDLRYSFDRSEIPANDSPINGAVVFSDTFENLYRFAVETNIEEFSNVAFVVVEKEDQPFARAVKLWAPQKNIGLMDFDRRELYVDGSSIKRDDYNSDEDYWAALRSYGGSKLVAPVKNYSFEVPVDSKFIYGQDFYLGDYVRIKLTDYAVDLAAQVAGASETFDTSGYRCEITFGSLSETLSKRLKKRLK